jgi:hypothetical protein
MFLGVVVSLLELSLYGPFADERRFQPCGYAKEVLSHVGGDFAFSPISLCAIAGSEEHLRFSVVRTVGFHESFTLVECVVGSINQYRLYHA